MLRTLYLVSSITLLWAPVAAAQWFDLPRGAATSDSVLAAAMPRIAEWAISVYTEPDRETYLDNLFRLQAAAGQYREAETTLDALTELRRATRPVLEFATLPYEVYVKARQRQSRVPLNIAFSRAFRDVFAGVDDRTAAHQARWVFGTSPVRLRSDLQAALQARQGRDGLDSAAAVDLVRKFLAAEVFETFAPWVSTLLEEDDQRRYVIEKDVRVVTPDSATLCALVVRPRAGPRRLPALLNFTIYADPEQNMYEARRTASHGYVGVTGLTRGKGCSPDAPVPIEHDGADAVALIEWIASRPWSDDRVGMYGGSYEGFTQWAAARHLPVALKAIMPSVAFAPGIDFPMDGNVFMSYAYPWPLYVTNDKGLDEATYFDRERWERLERAWYASGRAYRDLEAIDGRPNPIFRRWLDHPDYDAYWRGLVPSGEELARITVPVLTTTGYYDSGQTGALHYFREHRRHNPAAEHYLLIGPYDHVSGQRGTLSPLGRPATELRGYMLDPVAHIDLGELRYEWFDYVLRDGPRPDLLQDVVNYEVMGADAWKHAPSLEAMAGGKTRLYLTGQRREDDAVVTAVPGGPVIQVVDLADRTDLRRFSDEDGPINQALDTWPIVDTDARIANGVRFTTQPLTSPLEISGLFSGELELVTNKRDFDFSITLYERTSRGEYVHLSHLWARASYVRDRGRRQLLTPGERVRLPFESGRLTSRLLPPGSRLVVVLGILKQPGTEINYGTGGVVADETIADAGEPLTVQWLGGSYIDLPVAPRE